MIRSQYYEYIIYVYQSLCTFGTAAIYYYYYNLFYSNTIRKRSFTDFYTLLLIALQRYFHLFEKYKSPKKPQISIRAMNIRKQVALKRKTFICVPQKYLIQYYRLLDQRNHLACTSVFWPLLILLKVKNVVPSCERSENSLRTCLIHTHVAFLSSCRLINPIFDGFVRFEYDETGSAGWVTTETNFTVLVILYCNIVLLF